MCSKILEYNLLGRAVVVFLTCCGAWNLKLPGPGVALMGLLAGNFLLTVEVELALRSLSLDASLAGFLRDANLFKFDEDNVGLRVFDFRGGLSRDGRSVLDFFSLDWKNE